MTNQGTPINKGSDNDQSSVDDAAPPVPARLSRLSDHWGLVVAYGALTVTLGLVLVVWPESTLVVLAVLVAIQLLVSGVFRIITALTSSKLDGSGMRALAGLTGALAVLAGLLCLRSPLQTLNVLGLLIGTWWLVSGLMDVIGAVLTPHSDRRAWDLVMGLLSTVAGVYLVLNPKISLAALVIVASAWLFAYGFMIIVAGLRLRRGSTARDADRAAVGAGPGITAGQE